MSFSRGRTQVLFRYLPGALFIHDQHGICLVTSVDQEPLPDLNARALFDALEDYLGHWDDALRPGFILDGAGDPTRFYAIGAPRRVRFRPYPELLECTGCGRVAILSQLRGHTPTGRCPGCRQPMRQVRYVEAHHCGRLAPLVVPACPTHGNTHIRLETLGRFRTLAWRCIACGDRFIEGTRNRACACVCSKRQPKDSPARRLRGAIVTDPGLHMVHTIPFLNVPAAHIDAILADLDGRLLALARRCGSLDIPVADAVYQRRATADPAMPPALAAFVDQLRRSGLTDDFIMAQLAQTQPQAPPADDALMALETAFGIPRAALRSLIPRRVIEDAVVRDVASARAISTIQDELRSLGDSAGAVALEAGQQLATDLGIGEIRALDAFPIGICTAGYSRLTRSPNACMLVPFDLLPGDQRIPLYVLTTVTEGIAFQLDPTRVLTWLQQNNLVGALPSTTSPLEVWAKLYRAAPGLLQNRFQPKYTNTATLAVRTLVHSIAHALLTTIAWSGYDPSTVAEWLCPATLSCILFAQRYQDTKIGGLLTLVERGLAPWLAQARDTARSCLYDPLCSDEEHGACFDCLYREYGCSEFNRDLSRATLFGGGMAGRRAGETFPIRVGYWEGR